MQITAGTRSLRATVKFLIDKIANLFARMGTAEMSINTKAETGHSHTIANVRGSISINVYICDTVSNSSVRVSPWPQIENITAPEAWSIFMNDAIEQNFEPGTARRGSLYRSDVNHNGALNAIPLANYDLRYPTDIFLFIDSVFTNRVIVNLRFVELAAFRRLYFETPATRTRTVTVNIP